MVARKCDKVLEDMRRAARPENVAGMARYGICPKGTWGVTMPELKAIAKRYGKDHVLAIELWETGVHEARILAALTGEPSKVDRRLMDKWVREFDSWDVCDQVCSYLFSRTALAYEVIPDWARADEEFVRRAGFVILAALAVHDRKEDDSTFIHYFPLIEEQAGDGRNYVKKAVNWAIRQMGKRSLGLRAECLVLLERIKAQGSSSAKWIASDALRELNSPEVIARLEKRAKSRGQILDPMA